jgi:type VI secretion system secreted protein VgrG
MRPARAACATALVLALPLPAFAQLLGTASSFAVLGATPNVTNTGAASITGFPPGSIVPGTGSLHLGDTVAQQAQTDTTTAYNTLAGLTSTAIAPALGGQVLTPGVYNAGAANLTGTLTLNGPGLYVIQATALTTASGPAASSISFLGGATACDLWWQVGSSATIGTFSAMQGNILALTSITLGTSARLQGRALARNGTVTLDTDAVTACTGGSATGFIVGAAPTTPSAPAETPTLSEWAMVLLAALLAVVGYGAMRRRTTKG